MSESRITTDHATIRKWAEARDGRPAKVRDTGTDGDSGILRFDFGPPEDSLEEISWGEFFETFEENNLALLYQEDVQSRFNKFVRRSN
jgi:hypothetical protein